MLAKTALALSLLFLLPAAAAAAPVDHRCSGTGTTPPGCAFAGTLNIVNPDPYCFSGGSFSGTVTIDLYAVSPTGVYHYHATCTYSAGSPAGQSHAATGTPVVGSPLVISITVSSGATGGWTAGIYA